MNIIQSFRGLPILKILPFIPRSLFLQYFPIYLIVYSITTIQNFLGKYNHIPSFPFLFQSRKALNCYEVWSSTSHYTFHRTIGYWYLYEYVFMYIHKEEES